MKDSLPIPPSKEDEEDGYGFTFEVLEDEQTSEGKKVKGKGIYLIPNLITTAALLSGFFSILMSTSQQYEKAIYAIFLAALFDGLDGRAARLLNAQSPFGEQYDSLSDMISFGVAPAILVYSWALTPLGRVGLAFAFVYTACAAFRLARFNVQIGSVDKKYFVGLASPLAAIFLSALVWVSLDNFPKLVESSQVVEIAFGVAAVLIGLLMISNIKYFSFKQFDSKRVPFIIMLPVVALMVLVSQDFPLGLVAICLTYVLSGIWTTRKHFFSLPTTSKSN